MVEQGRKRRRVCAVRQRNALSAIDTLLASLSTDAAVRDVRTGPFWTAVLLDTDPPRCGLASTVHHGGHEAGPAAGDPGRLAQYSGLALAGLLRSPRVLEAAIGVAAYNALLTVGEAACLQANGRDLLLERGAGRRVAAVGHFPFVPLVRQVASACRGLELDPRPGDLPAERASEALPQADVVALTGTPLINHTFDALIALCRPDAFHPHGRQRTALARAPRSRRQRHCRDVSRGCTGRSAGCGPGRHLPPDTGQAAPDDGA